MAASTTADPSRAAQLKEAGNKLYVAKDYAAAYFKYSESIEADGKNAVLYANRAACSFAMSKYMDTVADCIKATYLDKKYTKAWVRLAASFKARSHNLGQFSESVRAYQQALESLPPPSNRTTTDLSFQRQCEDELRVIKANLSKGVKVTTTAAEMENEVPFIRAYRMRDELYTKGSAGANSSAWVILQAYLEFQQGVEWISLAKVMNTERGKAIYARPGAIEALTNATIRDSRVFHIKDLATFRDQYNLQVQHEINHSGGWTPVEGGSQFIMDKALKLKENKGWDAVRPALATTIRMWLMRGITEDGIMGNHDAALEFHTRAIEVLEWGRQVWRSVPKDDRGAIFEITFLRGVKSLRLDTMMRAHGQDKSKVSLEEMYQDAQDIIRETETGVPPVTADPGFVLSFFLYPRGQAYAITGLYYREIALIHLQDQDHTVPEGYYRKSAESYEKAARTYPVDDEYHVFYLCCAIDMMYQSDFRVRDFFTLMTQVHTAEPEMKKIWQYSVLSKDRDEKIRRTFMAEEELKRALAAGVFTMDSKVSGQYLANAA